MVIPSVGFYQSGGGGFSGLIVAGEISVALGLIDIAVSIEDQVTVELSGTSLAVDLAPAELAVSLSDQVTVEINESEIEVDL